TRQRLGKRLLDARGVVAHGRMAVERRAQCREPARDILRVGIGDLPHQKLGAHGKYFGDHGTSPPANAVHPMGISAFMISATVVASITAFGSVGSTSSSGAPGFWAL